MRIARFALLSALVATLLPAPRHSLAMGTFVHLNERNHPELQWLELRTEHFRIFFHDPIEPWAREAASILERHHTPLCRLLDVAPRQRTRVFLSDQDQIANGAAIGWDYFYVWVPSRATARSFAGGRAWFEEVLVHEYAHILISEAGRTWMGNFAFLLGMFPPRWLHEGIAQWTAERWSVLRGDRTLAAGVLDGSIDRNPAGVPGGGRLVHYARGHARVRWLADTHGDSTVAKLIRPAGRWGTYSYAAAEKAALGRDAPLWKDRFRREMIAFYGERHRSGETPESLGTEAPRGLAYPSWAMRTPDGSIWAVGQAQRGRAESSLFRTRPGHSPERVVAGSVSGRPVALPDGRIVFPRAHRVAHGSWVEDLAVWDSLAGTRFLTHGERIGEPCVGADDRLYALADAPAGPALVHASIPSGGSALFEPIRSWPRGWVLHGLASAPSGDRLALAAVDPTGRRGLWGVRVGRTEADTIRLTSGAGEARAPVWIDAERIAWTSHEGGISHPRAARWSERDALEGMRIPALLGTGVDVAGAWEDSLCLIDHSSRIRLAMRRVPAAGSTRRTVPKDPFPFRVATAVEPDSAEPVVLGPIPYRPLREVRRWLSVPWIAPQAGQIGLGYAGLWTEPLLRHAWGGYIVGNADQVRHPDRALFYLTTRWGPWMAAFHSSAVHPRRLLGSRILWERRESSGLAALALLQDTTDPNGSGWVDGHLKVESRRPRFGGRSLPTPLGPPRPWSGLLAGVGAGLTRVPPHGRGPTGPTEGWGVSIRLRQSLPLGTEQAEFFRGSLEGFRAAPLPGRLPVSLYGEGGLEWGAARIPAQEFVGLDGDPSHRWMGGWPGLDGTVHLRGWPVARAARAVLHGAVEARVAVLPDPGIRGPGVAVQGGTLAPFLEAGHPWGGASAAFHRERPRFAYGIEARCAGRLGPIPVVPAIAYARPLRSRGDRGFWTVRLTTSAPLAAPLHPPSALRALLGLALQD